MATHGLIDVKGIGPATLKKLNKANIFTVEDLALYEPEDLSKIEGIGIKSAFKWIDNAKQFIDKGQPLARRFSAKNSISLSVATLNEIQSDIKTIYKKLLYLEQRVNRLEKIYQNKAPDDIDIPAASSGNPYIRNEGLLYVILKKKFNEITKGKFGIKKVSINDLYESIIKDYSITREIFAEYLLILYNRQKIHLEPRFKDSEFSVRDNNGNSFSAVSILE